MNNVNRQNEQPTDTEDRPTVAGGEGIAGLGEEGEGTEKGGWQAPDSDGDANHPEEMLSVTL